MTIKSALPDYYQLLGLAPSAAPEEVKKRYREMARLYHPDINPSPEASHKIKAINEAYHTLNDPDRRALYDANRILNEATSSRTAGSDRTAPRSSASGPSPGAAKPAGGNRATGGGSTQSPYSSGKAGYNGFGRTAPDDSGTAQQHPASAARDNRTGTRSTEKPSPRTAVNSLISEAQLAFINRRYREAEVLCKQALELDKRNAVIYELLGDVYARKGQTDSATMAYSYAIQFNPRNFSVHGKLDRLIGGHEPHAAGPTVTRHAPAPTPAWGGLGDSHRDLSLLAFSGVLTLAFFGLLFSFHLNPGDAIVIGFPWLNLLSPNLLLAATCDGLIGGILLSFYGGMRPVSEELVRRKETPSQRSGPISLVLLLGLFSFVFFYLSAAVFLGVSLISGKLSGSLLRAYLATGSMIGIFALVASESVSRFDIGTIATFAGNILFPAVLSGWFIGDKIRLRGRRRN